VVLIHRFDVLGVDLHFHKFSSPNSSYFFRNRRFSLPISAKIDEKLIQNFSKKCEPAKAGPRPAKAGLFRWLATPASIRSSPSSCSSSLRSPSLLPPRSTPALPARSGPAPSAAYQLTIDQLNRRLPAPAPPCSSPSPSSRAPAKPPLALPCPHSRPGSLLNGHLPQRLPAPACSMPKHPA
jgi:hypothetical protein